jgi:hypothetical protein
LAVVDKKTGNVESLHPVQLAELEVVVKKVQNEDEEADEEKPPSNYVSISQIRFSFFSFGNTLNVNLGRYALRLMANSIDCMVLIPSRLRERCWERPLERRSESES